MADDNLIFVLDIGTRSVVGIAGRKQGDLFHVEAHAMVPHPRRAMIDGQIEDIEQVAKVAGEVKETIEAALGVTFRQVSVAAAGRALKTHRATAQMDLPTGVPITAQKVFELENTAVNTAREELDQARDETPYYCAGYSAVRYALDGYPFTTIQGHQGGRAEVEIIATFLPTEVVSSLRRCMELLELDIDTLTLEPIAAMRAVIPQDLRLLNLALVDIGAGTADIALSNDSTVSGYTMATVAGDEVTEALIRKYLVSFNTAEAMKLAVATQEAIAFTDILGYEHRADAAEVLETMGTAVDTLAKVVADKIVACNGGAPAAVFLVGGGSKTPGLPAKLAAGLGLEENRVALAGTNFSGRVVNEGAGLDDPEYATPLGIALVAADNLENEGLSVKINGRRVRLFSQQGTSLMDALLFGGYRYSDLMGRNGRSLTFTLNGVRTVLRGTPYTSAELTVNGRPASLATQVDSGDEVEMVPATSGVDAEAFIADYAEGAVPMAARLNGRPLAAGLVALVNGTLVPPDTPLFDGDDVAIYFVRTVADLCAAAGVPTQGAEITVGGQPAGPEHLLADGDVVLCTPDPAAPGATLPPAGLAPLQPKAAEAAPEAPSAAPPRPEPPAAPPAREPAPREDTPAPPASPMAAVPAPAETPRPATDTPKPEPAPNAPAPPPVETPRTVAQPVATAAAAPPPAPRATGAPAPAEADTDAPETPTPQPATPRSLRIELNGKTVVLPPKPDASPYQLFDMFSLVDIDPSKPQGTVKVQVNGRDSSYLDELRSGDRVEIGWETR